MLIFVLVNIVVHLLLPVLLPPAVPVPVASGRLIDLGALISNCKQTLDQQIEKKVQS